MIRLKKLQQDNRGMTMVEVLAGFTVLVLAMVSLNHIISFSEKMMMKSMDVMAAQQKMKKEVYKTVPDPSVGKEVTGVRFYLTETGENGVQLELTDAKVFSYEVEDMGGLVFRFRNR